MSCDLVLSNFASDHDVADLGDAIAHHLWQVILGQILFAVATFRQDQNSTAQSKQHLRMCRSEGLYMVVAEVPQAVPKELDIETTHRTPNRSR